MPDAILGFFGFLLALFAAWGILVVFTYVILRIVRRLQD